MTRCSLGVGCEEAGVCYASAHGQPERCGAQAVEARRAETTGSACESAVGGTDAPDSTLTNIYNHAAEVFAPLPDQFHRGGEEPNKTSPENK